MDWEGKRLELAGKLKERLRNIYLRDVSSRSFDLLIQAANGAWRDVKPPEPDEPPIGGDDPGGRKKLKLLILHLHLHLHHGSHLNLEMIMWKELSNITILSIKQ